MTIRIEVKSTKTETRTGTSQRNGRPYTLIEQRGWLHGLKDYPQEVSWLLADGQVPFAPGFYVADVECCEIDRFGGIVLNLQHMKPEARVKAA